MPNTKSADKHVRASETRRQSSSAIKSRLSSTQSKLNEAIAGGEKTQGTELYRKYCSYLDKAVKHGAIKANNASRNKSRAAARLATI